MKWITSSFCFVFSIFKFLPWPQQGPVNPGGHWQEYEQVFVLAMQLPLFKQGLELHGLVSISKIIILDLSFKITNFRMLSAIYFRFCF